MTTYKGKPCSVCALVDNGTDDRQLQPYGEGDALICYDCMMARPRGAEEYAEKFIAACQKMEAAEASMKCPRCRRRIRLRNDGAIPRHRMRGHQNPPECPASNTAPATPPNRSTDA